jgi:hypothetical protein
LIKKRREMLEKKGLEATEQHEEDNEGDRELTVLDIQMKAREAIKELKMMYLLMVLHCLDLTLLTPVSKRLSLCKWPCAEHPLALLE